MTSLSGDDPAFLISRQIADDWEEGLKEVEMVHQQTGNHLVTVNGAGAEVLCYGIATHYRSREKKKVITFAGSYDLHLVRESAGWKIGAFRFNSKYVE
ncbi:MAG: nuclear transport factor 2 family protein [bacterium]|nr:nuclear transport factor 2 family protein [bacterium]